ncbi:hypothetical protein C1H46_040665 [Malus baccata]|uniref:Triosephosphate isomerase, cytosolic n=1 Tax=Malus baccata TaxID=106549 RepID=A0A540KHZ7_MALBA|nr:hypothetical protein C1H46_040665 [Malus baccata]
MGLESLEGPDTGRGEPAGKVNDGSGSASAKQQKSWSADDDWRTPKIRRLTTQFLHCPLCDFEIIEKRWAGSSSSAATRNATEPSMSPPYVFIPVAKSLLRPVFHVTAQNCWVKKGGAFTDEVGAEMLVNLEVPWVILGHSERRLIFDESNEFVADKVAYALSQGVEPITVYIPEHEQSYIPEHEQMLPEKQPLQKNLKKMGP